MRFITHMNTTVMRFTDHMNATVMRFTDHMNATIMHKHETYQTDNDGRGFMCIALRVATQLSGGSSPTS